MEKCIVSIVKKYKKEIYENIIWNEYKTMKIKREEDRGVCVHGRTDIHYLWQQRKG